MFPLLFPLFISLLSSSHSPLLFSHSYVYSFICIFFFSQFISIVKFFRIFIKHFSYLLQFFLLRFVIPIPTQFFAFFVLFFIFYFLSSFFLHLFSCIEMTLFMIFLICTSVSQLKFSIFLKLFLHSD